MSGSDDLTPEELEKALSPTYSSRYVVDDWCRRLAQEVKRQRDRIPATEAALAEQCGLAMRAQLDQRDARAEVERLQRVCVQYADDLSDDGREMIVAQRDAARAEVERMQTCDVCNRPATRHTCRRHSQ